MRSFDGVWPYYVRRHLNPVNPALHSLGTTLALLAVGVSAALVAPL